MSACANPDLSGAQQLEMACAALEKMTLAVGKERAFLEVQSSWPMMSRDILEKMLQYARKPKTRAFEELMGLFASSMVHS